jgi:hypothetical protein
MTMEKFEEICSTLKKMGLIPTSIAGAHKRIFRDEKGKLTISVEFDTNQMTPEDEMRIKKRLKELGYLSEDEDVSEKGDSIFGEEPDKILTSDTLRKPR